MDAAAGMKLTPGQGRLGAIRACRGPDALVLPEPTPCNHRHTNIGGIPDAVMKVLIDEMDDGWDDSLRILGYDAYSVKKLRAQGHKLGNDNSVISYARENGMILVTRDNKSGSDCKKANIPCILLDSDELFRLVREKLGEYGSPTDSPK